MKRHVINVVKAGVRGAIGPAIAARRPVRTDLALSTWGIEASSTGRLRRSSVDLADLVAAHGSPLVVVDGDAVEHAALAALGTDPKRSSADIFYSYKTNPVPAVLRILHEQGVGAEVISPYELWLALRLGVPGERIIYNGPAKSFESLCEAVRVGALAINANSSHDLSLISHAAQAVGQRANVGIRVSLASTWQGQFGFNATSGALDEAVAEAQRSTDVDLRAIHVHRGAAMRTAADFQAYVSSVLAFLDALRSRTGFHPQILDLGGSLACPTVAPFERIQHRLNRALGTDLLSPDPTSVVGVGDAGVLAVEMVSAHAAAAGLESPKVVLEPGRALTSSSQMLLATVQDVKLDGTIPFAVLDAGMNVAEPTANEFHQLLHATKSNAAHDTSYRIVGPICTPADVLYNNWRLPTLEPGDVLAIMDTGAYFVPFSTSFSFPRPAIVVQRGHTVTLARGRETFEHLVTLDELP